MTQDDAPKFFENLVALGELCNRRMSEAVQVMYFEALRDIDLGNLVAAMHQAIKQCKYMPMPIELREFALGSLDEQALMFWNGWRKAAKIAGATRSVVCEGRLAIAIENTFGSWPEACTLEFSPEMWASKRKEFIANFRQAALVEDQQKMPNRLLRGTARIHEKWAPPISIEADGEVASVTLDEVKEMLHGGPDEREFTKLLSA